MPTKINSYTDSLPGGSAAQSQSRLSMNDISTDIQDDNFNRKYDLTPLGSKQSRRRVDEEPSGETRNVSIDPWETLSPLEDPDTTPKDLRKNEFFFASSHSNDSDSIGYHNNNEGVVDDEGGNNGRNVSHRSSFIMPSDIHPRMEEKEADIARLRLLAGKLNADWGAVDFMAPVIARRIRDFQFAQEKRRKKYGHEKPWGILGLYDHLACIRCDIEWAEDAAQRRANGQP